MCTLVMIQEALGSSSDRQRIKAHWEEGCCQPFVDCCKDVWGWDESNKSSEVRFRGPTVQFHPNWSNGTAAVRGNKILNHGLQFWEISVSERIFGTSMMFGLGTKKVRLYADAFINILGENEHSWALSHKGVLWHNGCWKQFTKPFRENEATTIGMCLDWPQGTLTYFKDGVCLGVAFRGLNKVTEDLYPMVSSTAAKTEMTLGLCLRGFDNLQDRCRVVIAQYCENNCIDDLPLPVKIKEYIKDMNP